MSRLFSLIAACVFALANPASANDLSIARAFGNHMVLQRDKPVPLWGRAKPASRVVVEFAGQTKAVDADAGGAWRVELDAMPVSAVGRALVVRQADAGAEVRLDDVLVGDVWLCSGQSNMAFRMKRVADAEREVAVANEPQIRFLMVKPQFAQSPASDIAGEWKPVTPANAEECSAVAYYFAKALREKHDVPVGLLISSVGGTRIETWLATDTLKSLGSAAGLMEKWSKVTPDEFAQIEAAYRAFQQDRDVLYWQRVKAAKAAGQPVPPEPKPPTMRPHDCPAALHNGMIVPLQPFAIRGILWYQGESNIGQHGGYDRLQSALIADWRKTWGAEIPFLFVQLPPFQGTTPQFREAQHRVWRGVPHTAMVVTLDVGDAKDVHPTRKQPVGERLALAARAISYGEPIEYSGPIFKSVTFDAGRAVVAFAHVGAGLVAKGDTLNGFTIAGADGTFVPATAKIVGDTVVVSSPEVKEPVAVRYAWANVPECNLFNKDGLPAAPFRSDAK